MAFSTFTWAMGLFQLGYFILVKIIEWKKKSVHKTVDCLLNLVAGTMIYSRIKTVLDDASWH